MLAGAAYRDEREWERTAWLAANVINVSGKVAKSAVTVDKLLGRKRASIVPQFPADPRAQVEELIRRQEALNAKRAAASED
jgi:hypothetical protein